MASATSITRDDGNLDLALLIGRMMLSCLFIVVGFGILQAPENFARFLTARGVPLPEVMTWVAILIEICGGLAVLAGFKTRLAALLLVVFVAAASLISHHFWTMDVPAERAGHLTHFFKDFALIGAFVMLAQLGGGKYSVDHWLRGRG